MIFAPRTDKVIGAAVLFAAAMFLPSFSAPVRDQAPGYFRHAVGDFVVTALQDGTISLGTNSYQGLTRDQMDALIARAFLPTAKGVPTSVNAYLVDTGAHRILVDAGNANCYGWKLGALPANLRSAGYAPGDVDIVVLTHLHGDHVCGLVTADGKRTFPNAAVWAAEEEVQYWQKNDGAPFVRVAMATYGAAFRTFKAGDTIAPGMRIIPAHGHTPGHTAFLFESNGASFLAWGDIVHCHALQFAHPEVSIGSDFDRKAAVATRLALFEQLAKDGTLIAGSHLPFPGIGHIRKERDGFTWVPIEFGHFPLK